MQGQLPLVLGLLAPVPYFHIFFRCLEILHHLLAAEGLLPAAPAAAAADAASGRGADAALERSPYAQASSAGSVSGEGGEDGSAARAQEGAQAGAGTGASGEDWDGGSEAQDASGSDAAAEEDGAALVPAPNDSAAGAPAPMQASAVRSVADMAATLPDKSSAATFLTALHIALADPPAPGSVLKLTLPRRSDYAQAPLPTVAVDVPRGGKSAAPRVLAFGDDFAEVQIPPHRTPLPGVPPMALAWQLPATMLTAYLVLCAWGLDSVSNACIKTDFESHSRLPKIRAQTAMLGTRWPIAHPKGLHSAPSLPVTASGALLNAVARLIAGQLTVSLRPK